MVCNDVKLKGLMQNTVYIIFDGTDQNIIYI